MNPWTCQGCGCETTGAKCEYCGQLRHAKAPAHAAPPKPLPQRPAKGTPMYQMGLEAAAFISRIPIGLGTPYDREAHRTHLVHRAAKYPGQGWDDAILEWDGYCRKRLAGESAQKGA